MSAENMNVNRPHPMAASKYLAAVKDLLILIYPRPRTVRQLQPVEESPECDKSHIVRGWNEVIAERTAAANSDLLRTT
jgi:hypothetical protein